MISHSFLLKSLFDKMFLMTYNWHWPGGPSGLIAPIFPVLDYAVSVVPRSKLMLGIPQYAYNWSITGAKKKGVPFSTKMPLTCTINMKVKFIMTKGQNHHGLDTKVRMELYTKFGLKIQEVSKPSSV
ncbi:hypothetical protein [Neobacillus piezotolerans]|uniref:hypothetical protein n=1 Tax=Neobacillus piezotolerans TaxID=2259171 RepID=UPI0015F15E0D|nr:hypothetical protein [Neobacillus piezotolerans]